MTSSNTPDISAALRDLLLARAAGKISAEEFERGQAELHARLLEPTPAPTPAAPAKPAASAAARPRREKWRVLLPVGFAALVLIVGGSLYAWLRHSKPAETAETTGVGGNAAVSAQATQEIQGLLSQVTTNPMNGEAWAALGRAYAAQDAHAKAADAFSRAAAIATPDAALLADWADSYVMAHERKWDETSRGILKRALAADPKYLKALSLAATEAFDNGRYRDAIDYWKRMKAVAPTDPDVAKYVASSIADATAAMGGTPAATGAAAAPASASISGTVSLAAKLRGKAAPSDTVFLFARTVEGQGPPLAVKRYTVADLPIDFSLDDSAAMVPTMALSKVIDAVVVARVSKSGNPLPQPGDLESAPQRVKVGTNGVKVEIDTAR